MRKCRVYRGMVIALRFAVTMKDLDYDRNFDQNWAWPKKTWFRERLNAVRAREEKIHRRATNNRKDAASIETKPRDDQGSEEEG